MYSIQINISKEPSKSGSDIQNAANLIKDIVLLENLSVKRTHGNAPFFHTILKRLDLISQPFGSSEIKFKKSFQGLF